MRDGVTSPARPAWIPAFAGMTERGAGNDGEGAGMDGEGGNDVFGARFRRRSD